MNPKRTIREIKYERESEKTREEMDESVGRKRGRVKTKKKKKENGCKMRGRVVEKEEGK